MENLAETLAGLADALAADFDIDVLAQVVSGGCADLLGVDAAGLVLTDRRSRPFVAGASNGRVRSLLSFEIRHAAGPCLESYRIGAPVGLSDLVRPGQRWPLLSAAVRSMGFESVHAVPLKLRETTIGVLGLFDDRPGGLTTAAARVAVATADIVTIGLLQRRAVKDRDALAKQLQSALDSRVVIEQAKGILAERLGTDMDTAFMSLRGYARNHNTRLADVAHALVQGQITDIRAVG